MSMVTVQGSLLDQSNEEADLVGSRPVATSGELATTMIVRGAVGTLIGAAVAPKGREGLWGAAGFAMGATLGEIGIVGVALGALWRKAER